MKLLALLTAVALLVALVPACSTDAAGRQLREEKGGRSDTAISASPLPRVSASPATPAPAPRIQFRTTPPPIRERPRNELPGSWGERLYFDGRVIEPLVVLNGKVVSE